MSSQNRKKNEDRKKRVVWRPFVEERRAIKPKKKLYIDVCVWSRDVGRRVKSWWLMHQQQQ